MKPYQGYTRIQLKELQEEVESKYSKYKAQNLNLNMARGKPCLEQLELADKLYTSEEALISKDGIDCRNYGGVEGVPEARKLFARLLGVKEEELIIGGNSSLQMMYDTIARAFNHGLYSFNTPWSKVEKIKFLCPVPGYDRHFSICELFGIEMINIPMTDKGPEIELIEKLVSSDDSIKGMWCVPRYSNPTGVTIADEIVERLASMKTKSADFRIFCDDAYLVHHLTDNPPVLKNIIRACQKAGNPHRILMFASTSKITYAGGGLAMLAASRENIEHLIKLISIQTIGPNKVNQLLHTRFFKSVDGIKEHMKKHTEIIKPKFNLVLKILQDKLAHKQLASWSNPRGGYFISLDVMNGCARRVVELAKEAGVTLTPAGATYPYKKDPDDKNIRIAPTFPPLDELEKAIKIVCVCIEKTTLEKILNNN
ncbi:MAG TPA: aminotransferase class I/II-fold pyridoxal phosphate-dependent enzyme [Halanaerobiales bacterium]|nr:aminotransferase class I/II-fold pyridoxal phosphate-dependent enzyme [Halanaerobiales bacterium]